MNRSFRLVALALWVALLALAGRSQAVTVGQCGGNPTCICEANCEATEAACLTACKGNATCDQGCETRLAICDAGCR